MLATLLLFAAAFQSEWRVALRSFGPVRYGMTLREASRALGGLSDTTEASPECFYVTGRQAPPGTGFMVVNRQIARVDVDTPGVLTLSGIGVGSTEAEVRAAYPGQIRTESHPYSGPEWHYLIYVPRDRADRRFGLIFETDGVRVRSYRAGRQPEVRWIEGCA